MAKILVTGAGGYIGSVATDLLLKKGHEVVAIDNFVTGFKQPLDFLQQKYSKDKLRWYEADLKGNLDNFFNQEKDIEAVIHYAAHCIVNESMKDPLKYFLNNTGGTTNFLSYLLKYGVNKVVFSSTCAVYGEAEYVPVDEKHPTIPTNPYGESKRMSEKTIEWLGKLKGLNYMILRYFNVCGASDDGTVGDSKRPSVLLVQNAVRGALGIEPFYLTCPEVDTPDKTPIRDYVNVVDLNEAHLLALEHLFSGKQSDLINLGTGTGNSVLEIVEAVKKVTGKKFDLQKTTPREGEYAKMYADITRAETILKWKPKRTIEDSIKSLVTWYTSHPQGWQK